MRKQITLLLLGAFGLLILPSLYQGRTADDEIPEEIGAILKSSCLGCHNSEGRSEDAKNAVQFDAWDDYRVTKKIGILGKMGEVIEEGKMPPERYLENNPDKKLTEEQKKLLLDWTKQESERLMQGN
jgi:hypothetical protein